jgi:hypothetical protein
LLENNTLIDKLDAKPSALAIRVSSLACEVYRVLLVAIIIVYLRLYIAFVHIIIGTMMDHEVIWSSRKDGVRRIVLP